MSAGAVLLVYLYLYRTRLGTLTRAVMVSREESLATGIDVHRVSALAFGIGLALAGLSGVFAPFMLGSVTPAIGGDINVAAFAVIVSARSATRSAPCSAASSTASPCC